MKTLSKIFLPLILLPGLIAFFVKKYGNNFDFEELSKPLVDKVKKVEDSLELTKRQKELLEYIKFRAEVDMKKLKKEFNNVTDRTLRRDLIHLSEKKLVQKKGNTSNSIYSIL